MLSILAALVTLGGLVNAQGFVSLPFTKEKLDRSLLTNTPLKSRAALAILENEILIYVVTFSLGNQEQRAIIDTGSSDLWVYSSQTSAEFTYDPSYAELISDNFEMSYVDGSQALGGYYRDKLTIGSVTVDAQFGISASYNGYPPWGWFGIGRRHSESSYLNGEGTYDNYPYALRNAGYIETAAYSLNLNSRDTTSGTILFGAVDTSRYTGKLQLISGQADAFLEVQFGVAGSTLVGTLDSGASYTYLPEDVVYRIATSVGAKWDEFSQSYLLHHQPDNEGLKYNFFGTKVIVPPSELLRPIFVTPCTMAYQLTVFPASQMQDRIILGDSFLRSAYTVFDVEHNRVAIAQASWSDSPANYQLITSAGIPGASW